MNEGIFNEIAKRYDNEYRRHLAGVVLNELKQHLGIQKIKSCLITAP